MARGNGYISNFKRRRTQVKYSGMHIFRMMKMQGIAMKTKLNEITRVPYQPHGTRY